MNFTDELRQLSTDMQKSVEDKKKSHAVEKEFVNWIVELIKDKCKEDALKGKTHLQGYLYKDGDCHYSIFHPNSVHTFCDGIIYVYPQKHYLSGFGGYDVTHDLEDDMFIANELRNRLNSLGFINVTVNLTYSGKVEESTEYKYTLFGAKTVKKTTVIKNYWKNIFISIDW